MSLILTSILNVAAPAPPDFSADNLQYPATAVHRGGPLEAPESTMRAFRNIRDNYPGSLLEFDVHRLKDGALVLWHDKTVNGTPVKDMTTTQWRKVRVEGVGGSEPAPFLNEVLTEFGNTDISMFVELKDDEALSPFIAALWPWRGNIIVWSFTEATVSVLARSGFKAGQLSSSYVPPIVKGAYAVGIKHTLATPTNITTVHNAGQYMWAWTVNDQPTIDNLLNMGVDGIITDDPRLDVT